MKTPRITIGILFWALFFGGQLMGQNSNPVVLDIKELDSRFPVNLTATSNHGRLFTPESLIRNERFMRELPKEVTAAPADVFAFRKEPVVSYGTQYGGTPFVEAGFEWPKLDGDLLQFWGNFYFGDSLDLLNRKLPGDVLNIFVVRGQIQQPEFAVAIWSKAASGHRLDPAAVPADVRNQFLFHGVRHRTKLVVDSIPAVKGKMQKWQDFKSKARVNEVVAITNKHPFLENGFDPYPFKKRDNSKLVAVASWFKSTGKWPLLDSEPAMTFPNETDEGFFLIFVEEDGTTEIGYGR